MYSQPNIKIPYLQKTLHIVYSILFAAFWVYTGLTTSDLNNWLLENTLTLSLIIFLIAFYNIFRFSDLSYTLIFLFLLLHVYGSQHQYPDNPFGEWLKQNYNLERNHYDRFVHFGYGLLLTYPIHEVLAHGFKLKKLINYLLPIELILSSSALYEIVEWMVADWVYDGGEAGMNFLGMQGDIWDAQKDIALAFTGACITMATAYLLRSKNNASELS
ncbi:DUF2238 domain-containing protein [Pontibacter harenae]|uniref:DUF2238 domain-containing protein n=1 Tax=Pontibacter harenae TaxID=2894083 RepID=UPI001E51E254|nr:DUF2238 domain-containing protein [Pontibacter harenae]MCC9166693.1 DUF2238 domain-containing protein [Pontibacter harenae]